eukprot:TRINITY_DN26299_c0_g1_i1.p1 TRINITY_DN26299_c0_g1~~TRINITY_DN26299_c0_g1_i1.p1  ORF type:complete len:118 (-),score=23.37 TRINITY_DN26299_c0_g1_i1:89-442(-)
MSDPYKSAKGGRLTFKGGGGGLAALKTIDKKKSKKKKKNDDTKPSDGDVSGDVSVVSAETGGGEEIYTIDAAKRMKYGELFPVEAKKFGYEAIAQQSRSVEEALDDRVKKKADRYCK